MKFSLIDLFFIKKRFKERILKQKRNQEFRIIESKKKLFRNLEYQNIEYNINPFLCTSKVKKQVLYIEDIEVTYKGIYDEPKKIEYIIKNPYLKKKLRKKLVIEILKKWQYDYFLEIDNQLKKIIEQTAYLPIKKIKKIKNIRINLFVIISFIFLIFLKQYSILQLVWVIGPFFSKLNRILIYSRYYDIAVIIVYLSILIAMYLIIVKVYFEKVLKFGMSARGFLIKERDSMLKKFNPSLKKIRKHLFKIIKHQKIESYYKINDIYNSKIVVSRIKRYGRNMINRVGIFTTRYNHIIFFSKCLQVIDLLLILYILISMIFI